MSQNQIIAGAIKNLIDGTKRILIPNAIATLTANLSEACKNKDFYLIDYNNYAKQIIDNSKLPQNRKEEIHQRFKNPSLPLTPKEPIRFGQQIKEKVVFFSNPVVQANNTSSSPLKIESSSPTLVASNITHFDEIQKNTQMYHKTRYCRACNEPIEENLLYHSGYPYHDHCIKCMKCSSSPDTSALHKSLSNYISITPGLFLCRQHYQELRSTPESMADISTEYHKKNKENFVNDLFDIPLKNGKIINDDDDDEIITQEIIEESIPIKRPFDIFLPTMTVRFDMLPSEIDYEKFQSLIGPEFEIINVEKGSTIIKIAYLEEISTKSDEIEKSTFIKKCEELGMKLNSSIGKGIVGNIIEEPIYSIPDDKKIQEEYNKPWLNSLQNIHELDEYDFEYIKKSVLKILKNNASQKNWSFVFQHEEIYEDVEKQIMKDVLQSEIELIIVAQTIITNKNIDKYYEIVKKIKPEDSKQLFLYHGTPLTNHQSIVNKHFLIQGQDQLKNKTDSGYFGKGIYATDNMFYASKYANCYNDLDFNEKAHVICCMAVYNTSKVKELNDLSFLGQKIDNDITSNYGIHHAFVGSSNRYEPIQRNEKKINYISADEFVFPNKFQIIPIYSFTVMRKDHFILWNDMNVNNNDQNYLQEISKKSQVNVYNSKSVDEAIKIIETKKRNKFKLITNGGCPELIQEARKIINSDFVCFVFSNDRSQLNWITQTTNVLFGSNFDDLKNFVDLRLNEDDVYKFALELKNKYNYDFKLDKSKLVDFPTASRSNYDIKDYHPENVIDANESDEYNAFLSLIDKIIKLDRSLSPEDKIFVSVGFKAFIKSKLNPVLFFEEFYGNESIQSIIGIREQKEGFQEIDLFYEMTNIVLQKFIVIEDEGNSDIFDLKVKARFMFTVFLNKYLPSIQSISS